MKGKKTKNAKWPLAVLISQIWNEVMKRFKSNNKPQRRNSHSITFPCASEQKDNVDFNRTPRSLTPTSIRGHTSLPPIVSQKQEVMIPKKVKQKPQIAALRPPKKKLLPSQSKCGLPPLLFFFFLGLNVMVFFLWSRKPLRPSLSEQLSQVAKCAEEITKLVVNCYDSLILFVY